MAKCELKRSRQDKGYFFRMTSEEFSDASVIAQGDILGRVTCVAHVLDEWIEESGIHYREIHTRETTIHIQL